MTAWACVVAERLGFKRQEALSIGAPLLNRSRVTLSALLIHDHLQLTFSPT